VAEESKGAKAGPATDNAADPAAIAIALSAAPNSERVAAKAEEYLEKQKQLVELQTKELAHELELRHWSLLVRHLSGLLRLTLEIGLAMAALGLACFIAAGVWNAAHAEGLIIESFSVPPDMTARGFTGQVIATKTLDELAAMVNSTITSRAAKSYASNWGNDIRVEIPETGISIGEAFRFLKTWLGHETHITGEVTRTATGIAVTARASGNTSLTVSGNEADLDALIHRTAEHIYGSTQPYRYALYLSRLYRDDEATPIFKNLIAMGPARERPWGYIGLSNTLANHGDIVTRISLLESALALQPDNILAQNIRIMSLEFSGRQEEAFRGEELLQATFHRGGGSDLIDAERVPGLRKMSDTRVALTSGDFLKAAQDGAEALALHGPSPIQSLSDPKALAEVGAHDIAAARATMRDPDTFGITPGFSGLTDIATRMWLDSEAEDWMAVLSRVKAVDLLVAKYPGVRTSVPTMIAPLIAYAQARLKDFTAAEELIAQTPGNCYPCLRVRARIAEQRGQYARADYWFDRAARAGPSLPFVPTELGQALLERGKPDEAIAQFRLANEKGPHFADPLEGWGEALIAKNQSHLALAKFEEAGKYAPNWGRLHLKWGQALAYSGNKTEAAKHFARAAQLNLTLSEKAELARHP